MKCSFLARILILVLSPLAMAQDLKSEFELRPITRWVNEEGFSPEILECRLSKNSHLQCVAGANLINVRCEGTQFGRRTNLKAVFKGRAFSCEGTRLDHESLMTQWKLNLKADDGSESTWIVDAADEAQLERLYRTEMKASPLVEQVSRPFWSVFLGGRQTRWGADSQQLTGAELRFGRARWLIGGDFYQAAIPASEEDSVNAFRLSGSFALGSANAGRGWVMGLSTGHDFLKGELRATSHCLGPEYLINPGRWRFSAASGNCWYPSSTVNFSPWASVSVAREVYGPLALNLGLRSRYVSGSMQNQDVSGVDVQVQLGVSVSIAPR